MRRGSSRVSRREGEKARAKYEAALREQVARRNRADFPEAAAFVDKVREAFGPGVEVTYFGPIRERRDPSLPEKEWVD